MSTPGELRTKRPRIVPDGIVAHKRDLAQRGGFTAVGIAGALSLLGALVLALTSSAFFGAIGFVAITCGVPLLPMVGLPARTGAMRWLIAIVGSAAIWWWVGQLSAARVRKLAVASWADWAKEFGLYAAALVLGVIFALLIAEMSLGAL